MASGGSGVTRRPPGEGEGEGSVTGEIKQTQKQIPSSPEPMFCQNQVAGLHFLGMKPNGAENVKRAGIFPWV